MKPIGKKGFGRDEGEAKTAVREEGRRLVWSRHGSILGDVGGVWGEGGSRRANHFSHYPVVSPHSGD